MAAVGVTREVTRSRGIGFWVVILIVGILLLAVGLPRVEDLEFTSHARNSRHLKEAWNALSIYQLIEAGSCTPQEWACRDEVLFLCPLPDGRWGGLPTSYEGRIITGFAADEGYWTQVIESHSCTRTR